MAEAEDQETYLNQTTISAILKRGVKKLLTEVTSVKFLLLVFVCAGMWWGKIPTEAGLGFVLLLTGLREVPVDVIIARFVGTK